VKESSKVAQKLEESSSEIRVINFTPAADQVKHY